MSGRRIALITRRFWPLVGERESALADLAVGFRDAGERPTIITAQWNKGWPAQFAYEDVPVVRLPKPSLGWWADWGYARRLTSWLNQFADEIDIVTIACDNPDAAAVITSLQGTSVPVLLLANDAGDWLTTLRKQLPQVAALVVPDEQTRIAVIAAQCPAHTIRVIPPGIPIPPPRTGDQRRHARDALAKICGGGKLSPLAPLAVSLGPLDVDRQLSVLIEAWPQVLKRHADARLWIFGDGRSRANLCDEVNNAKLLDRIFLPGAIDCLDDLFAAADVLINPGSETTYSHTILSAMAAGLPVVIADTPAHRRVVTNNEHGLMFATDDVASLETVVLRLFGQPTLANALGENGRKRVEEKLSMEHQVRLFSELIDRVLDRGV